MRINYLLNANFFCIFKACLGNLANATTKGNNLNIEDLSRSARRWTNPEYRQKHAAWNSAWENGPGKSPERLAKRAAQMRAYRKTDAYQQMQKAHGLVRRAISSGILKKLPCEKCGSVDTEAHHEDYKMPLTVNWLCKLHHVEQHRKAP